MSNAGSDGGGYQNPPTGQQFKPGQSGNPNGRPRGSKSAAKSYKAWLNEVVMVPTPTGPRRMTRFGVMFERALAMALKGDHRAERNINLLKEKLGLVQLEPEPQRFGVLRLKRDPEERRRQLVEAGFSPESIDRRMKGVSDDGT